MLLTVLISLPFLAVCFIALLQPKHLRLIEWTAAGASVAELGLALALIPRVLSSGPVRASDLFSLDALGAFVVLIIALIGCVVSVYSVGYLRAEVNKSIIGPRRVRQYFLLLELFLFAMFLAAGTVNPVVMWIAIEATTLSTAFLITFYNKPSATEAGWKYLILNSLGLLLSLLGTLLFLALPEDKSGLLSWEHLRSFASSFSPFAVKMAFVCIVVGYGTKIGLVPMHTWLPDAHSKAPAPISALLSGVLLNVALFAVLRFKGVTESAVGTAFTEQVLLFFGGLSIAVAAFIIFVQRNYKRLLAYSSIEHMGLVVLGIGFGGAGVFAAFLQMFYHSLAKSLLFLISGNIFLKYSSTKIPNVSGMLIALPFSGVLFFAAALALVGMPPSGIFFSKFLLLSAGINAHPVLAGGVLLLLGVVFFGFLKHLTSMSFGSLPEGIGAGEYSLWTRIPLVFLAALLLFSGFFLPETLSQLIEAAIRTVVPSA